MRLERHLRRDRFGRAKLPSKAMAAFKEAQAQGTVDPQHTWKTFNRAWRKKRDKKRIARKSRKANRQG
jgi:hypothetical protein